MKAHLKSLFILLALVAFSTAGFSADGSSLKPPPGAKVAIVVFEDLECPDCKNAYPLVWDVANAHHIPVVLHDFPLSIHPWSFEAAIYARYFDTKSQKLGNDFRGYIYKNQPQIMAANLRQYVQKFADDNKVPLPFAVDPQGTLKAKVQADSALGTSIGLKHTPTIFVVGNGGPSTPFVEVEDRSQLTQIVEDMQRRAGPDTPAKPVSAKAHKKTN
ncbi:MAG TPA: thioredoxin domain-containing protein [Candidatus Angelobacter sp.]